MTVKIFRVLELLTITSCNYKNIVKWKGDECPMSPDVGSCRYF